MPTYTWDSAFEASPADSDELKYGASEIRELKLAISERLEVEHTFKANGKHDPGKVSCVYSGTTAQIAALTGMSAGAFAYNTDTGQFSRYTGAAWVLLPALLSATGGGTVDAITATFSPALTVLTNNTLICVIAAGANVTTTPTFSPNGLTAKTIVKGSNQALVAGDIPGANAVLLLRYDSGLDKWVLINPAYAVSVVPAWTYKIAVLQNRKDPGVNGGNVVSGDWYDIPLNVEQEDSSNIVDSSSLPAFTLAAGTYLFRATAPFQNVGLSQIRLKNVTANSFIYGSVCREGGVDVTQVSHLVGSQVLANSSEMRLQYRVSTSRTGTGLGQAANFGANEVYQQVEITQLS
jgi:hypothetical protein